MLQLRLLQRAHTQARRCETSGYITFCWRYRKFSQDFKEVSKPAHRPVQPALQTSRFTQFCVNTASRYHLQIKSQYERSLPGCYPARPALLTVCRSAGGEAPGAALFLCMVLIVHIDNNRFPSTVVCNSSHTYSLDQLTTYNN